LFCTACGAATSDTARFCAQCGQSLARGETERRGYTPRHLVEAVLQRRTTLEGERKQVTVLFCDIVDSVEHSAKVGAEQWHYVLDGFFRMLNDGIHRFEGTVNQYTGDGVMALFGAPVAHEDHVQRACHAALHIRESVREYAHELKSQFQIDFRIRIGVNSGEVVVGRIGDDLRMDYTAQGETVGLAARLQNAAAPGTVLLSARSAEIASGYLETEAIEPLRLKGISQPVAARRLVGVGSVQDRFGQSRRRGLSPFVGRDAELERLDARFAEVCRSQPHVVALSAPAGAGKSRLVHEASRHFEEAGARVIAARGFTHRQVVPLRSLAELISGLLGIEREADAEARLLALNDASARFGMDVDGVLPLIGDLLGVGHEHSGPEQSPDASERQLISFARSLLLACAKEAPIVLVIEDLEWMDRATRRILAAAAVLVGEESTRVLVLLATRNPDASRWFPATIRETLALRPLSDDSACSLIDALLGPDPSLAATRRSILETTAGNPFFIEEVVRSLAQSGQLRGSPGLRRLGQSAPAVVVPDTVQAVLSARIDQLHEDDKDVLHGAAIVGSEFSELLLLQLLEIDPERLASSLHELVLADFIEEKSRHPEPEYRFKHPLTREVAYRTQLKTGRQRAHGRLASALTELHQGQIGRAAPLIGQHLESAGDHLAAARMWHEAAEGKVSSLADRTRYWRRVLECAQRVPANAEAEELELAGCSHLLSLAWANGMQRDEADALLDRGLSIIQGQPREPFARMLLYIHFGRMLLSNESADAYCEYAVLARDSAEQVESKELTDGVESAVVHSLTYAGWPEPALELADRLLVDLPPFTEPERFGAAGFQADRFLFLRCMRCELRMLIGRFEEAEPELRSIIDEVVERKQLELMVLPRYTLARGYWLRQDDVDLRDIAERGVAIAEDIGSTSQRVMANGCLGISQLIVGEHDAAITSFRTGLRVVEEHAVGFELAALLKTHLSAALRGAGDPDAALASAEEAVVDASLRRFRFVHNQALLERGLCLRALRRDHEARRSLEEAADLAGKTRSAALVPLIRKALES
jgi:class 3 adenylate cyclase/tetratricopeptide (TPR) repeat protein